MLVNNVKSTNNSKFNKLILSTCLLLHHYAIPKTIQPIYNNNKLNHKTTYIYVNAIVIVL